MKHSIALTCVILAVATGCRKTSQSAPEVVLYTSVDEPFVRPLIDQFKQQTGIDVRLVTDAESTKTAGLAEKLLAEKDHPLADVYWGNEPFHTINLADAGALVPYHLVTSQIREEFKAKSEMYVPVGLRARMIAVSTRNELSALASKVKTLKALADPALKGRIGISHPGFGTASGHVAALYIAWGDEATDAWLRSLADNGVLLLGGNSVVAEQVSAGTLVAGLTDNDDIAGQKADHQPIEAVLPDQEGQGTLLIPTTVALVKGAPHRPQAEKLLEFLTTAQVEKDLIDRHFLAYSVRPDATLPRHLEVNLDQVAHRMHDAVERSLKILQKR